MNGLLGTSFDDPRTMGLLALSASLMSSPRLGPGLMQGLMSYGQTMSEAKRQKQADDINAVKMEQARMQMEQMRQAQEQQIRDRSLTQQQFAPMPGPTQDGGPLIPRMDPRTFLGQGGSMEGAQNLVQMHELLNPRHKPTILGEGEVAFGPGGEKLFDNPKAPKPIDYNDLIIPGPDGRPMLNEMALEAKRKVAAAGASRVNVPVSVNTAKAFGATMAEETAKQTAASHANARAALGSIDTAQRLKQAVDSGKLVSGPGATFRVLGLQVGQMLGVGGKDGAETLANTRTAIQSMAQAELDAAMQMKGQGQITEAERDIIRRAASGSIDTLTAPEIRLLADSLEKVGRNKIRAHQSNLNSLKGIQGSEPLVPMLQLQEPPSYQQAQPQTQQPNAGQPARVTNDAEYNALPSGSTYVGPDGKIRRKR